jgi:hypothetical protein
MVTPHTLDAHLAPAFRHKSNEAQSQILAWRRAIETWPCLAVAVAVRFVLGEGIVEVGNVHVVLAEVVYGVWSLGLNECGQVVGSLFELWSLCSDCPRIFFRSCVFDERVSHTFALVKLGTLGLVLRLHRPRRLDLGQWLALGLFGCIHPWLHICIVLLVRRA